MKIIKADLSDLGTIHEIVSKSIKGSYSKIYSKEVVELFLKIHSRENIESDLKNNSNWLIEEDGKYVGTACAKENYLSRLYILPEFQKRGIGTKMMAFLENEVSKNYDEAYLSPSLPGLNLYKKLGYKVVKHREHKMNDGTTLNHDDMMKKLK